MYLDKILGSKTKINILAILVNAKDKEFAESELAKEIGCSLSEVNRQIPLEKSELKEHLKFAEDLFFKVKSVVKF